MNLKKIRNLKIQQKIDALFKIIIAVFLLNSLFLNLYTTYSSKVIRSLVNQLPEGSGSYTHVMVFQTLVVLFSILFFVITLLVCFKLGRQVSANITQPVNELETAAQQMAQGDLNIDIQYHSEDELGVLAESFRTTSTFLKEVLADLNQLVTEFSKGNFAARSNNKEMYVGDFASILEALVIMEEQISTTLGDVQEASGQVSAGSSQLAESAQSLAEGATDQAASVEELLASVEDVSNRILENAKSTDIVHDKAKMIAVQADNGKAKMEELMTAMERITNTSNDIQMVVEKIESIASQTNLLSLNASIEAARAGDAGRGFAVVAEQIKKLAEESASSAVETRDMLGNNVAQITIGNDTAVQTSQYMNSMIEELDHVVLEVAKIRTVSDGQAETIQQISQAVEQINGVVQSNSAASEEVSATSEELSASAQSLNELLASFQLKN